MKKFLALLFFGIYFISALAQNAAAITEQEAIQRAIVELHTNSRKPASWIPESISDDRISAKLDGNKWLVFFWGEVDQYGGVMDGDHLYVELTPQGEFVKVWYGM